MDKLKMAHDYLRDIIKASGGNIDVVEMPEAAWKLAEAMQAEAEKRESKERPDVLKEEWQPDWSKAPEWAVAWTMDSGETLWWSHKPELKNGYWFVEDSVLWKCEEAPSFGFTGTHIVERPHGF